MSDPACSDCVHAAFDAGGVYCKLFREQILNERTAAASCGAFELAEPVPVLQFPTLSQIAPLSERLKITEPELEASATTAQQEWTEQDWVRIFREYLDEQHVTLWGSSFMLLDGGRERAATWLASVVTEAVGRQRA